MDFDANLQGTRDRIDGDVVVRRADAACGEQVVMESLSSAMTRTSRNLIPCTFSQDAIWAIFLSWVRPDRISSPITISAAVQIRSLTGMRLAIAFDASAA
jgi:hypothetical protein